MGFLADYEDDEWPDLTGDGRGHHGSPFFNGSATELGGTFRRFPFRRRRDTVLYNMAVILAAVATGFDIRLCNTTGRHPRMILDGGDDMGSVQSIHSHCSSLHDSPALDRLGSKRDSLASTDSHPSNRDAYYAAVRDNFIEPETEYQGFHYSSTPGFPHNTFHGIQTRFRPSVNFEVPLRFTEAVDWGRDPHVTPSTTDSGMSPHKSSRSSDIEDMALISLSPSQDKAFIEYQRQMSDTSSSMYETPKTTPKTTPQRYNVKFEEGIHNSPSSSLSHQRSPSNTSSSSVPSHDYAAKYSSGYDSDPHSQGTQTIKPPPTRRQNSSEVQQHATPERPYTLDIISRPRPHPKSLKMSPVHMGNNSSPRSRITPTPSDSISAGDESSSYASARSSNIYINSRSSPRSRITPTPSDSLSAGGDDASYLSARSAPSPGSTPPHIDHQKTLLDIDVEGQDKDITTPLPILRRRPHPPVPPPISELEREFLS